MNTDIRGAPPLAPTLYGMETLTLLRARATALAFAVLHRRRAASAQGMCNFDRGVDVRMLARFEDNTVFRDGVACLTEGTLILSHTRIISAVISQAPVT